MSLATEEARGFARQPRAAARARGIGPVLFPFTGANTGGSHISSFHLARSLVDDFGIRAVVVAVEGTAIAEEARKRGLETRLVPAPPKRRLLEPRDLTEFGLRRRLFAEFGPGAIVHCSDLWSIAAFAPAAKSLRLTVIYHNRTIDRGGPRDRLLLGLTDAVISISDACRNALRAPKSLKVVGILNPFEEAPQEIDRASARAEFEALWPIEGLQLVGSSGNFVRRKRADFFIRAAAAVAGRNERARFILFGAERDHKTEELRALARSLGIEDKVLFAGFRSPPEKNLAALDVLAVPALAEPFGRTLVEAAMLGTPYVATDDAGHTEIGRRWGGGSLVPADAGPEAFAAAILEVLRDPAAAALSGPERAALAEELHPARHAARVVQVYEETAR